MTDRDDWIGLGDRYGTPLLGISATQDRAMRDARLRAMSNYAASGHAAVMTDEEKQRRKACPNKSLTKPPGYYLTSDEGSPCERIEPVSVQWRKEFQDKADTFDEESYSDGYSQGFAGGLNFTSQSGYEDEPKEFEGVKIKPQGIDTDEFRKQCEDIERGE